jgi:hypothetical protein
MKIKVLLVMTVLLYLAGCAAKTGERRGAGTGTPLGNDMFSSCLSGDEAELAALINSRRSAQGLPDVPVTASLHAVAKWHAIDLVLNKPHQGKTDERGKPCTLRSWSDQGAGRGGGDGWLAVCYTADHRYKEGMWNKPREIAGYPAEGYENVYSGGDTIVPEVIVGKWVKEEASRELIHEEGVWKNSGWKAMGVGMYGSYAAVWFGRQEDVRGVVGSCGK